MWKTFLIAGQRNTDQLLQSTPDSRPTTHMVEEVMVETSFLSPLLHVVANSPTEERANTLLEGLGGEMIRETIPAARTSHPLAMMTLDTSRRISDLVTLGREKIRGVTIPLPSLAICPMSNTAPIEDLDANRRTPTTSQGSTTEPNSQRKI